MATDDRRLDPYRSQDSPLQEHVIDEFLGGRLSRRDFVRHATTFGVSMSTLGAILGVAGCGATGSTKSTNQGATGVGHANATIHVGQLAPGSRVNPLTAATSGQIETMSLVGEWLTIVGYDLVVRPWLAESWTPNSDATVWTFKIRKGVKFNDGTPMTVDDVVYTFKQQADPKIGVNAASVFGGVLTPDGVEKVDDQHVRFRLETAVGEWPIYGVSQQNYNLCIVPNHYDWSKFQDDFPGTGHFKMVNYSDQTGGTFVRNPHYWGAPAKPATIEVSYFSDEQSETSGLEGGSIDVNDLFSVVNSPQLLTGGYNVIASKASWSNQVQLRCDSGPFANKLVRQALALTLDRPGIIDAVFKKYATLGNDSPFAPIYPSTNKQVPQRKQNIPAAKKLMAQAGVSRGFKAAMITTPDSAQPEVLQIYKASASKIGIDLDTTVMSDTQYYGALTFGHSPWLDTTATMTFYSAYAVPNTILTATLVSYDPKTGSGAWNGSHFNNAEFDRLNSQFDGTPDVASQRRISGKIENLLLDETPVIVPYFFDNLTAMRKGVYGVKPVVGTVFYWNMTKS